MTNTLPVRDAHDSATTRPATKPARPHFSSGPCAKRRGWTPAALNDAVVRALALLEGRQGRVERGGRPDTHCARHPG